MFTIKDFVLISVITLHYTVKYSDATLCYDCIDMSHPRDCTRITSCAPHEICSVKRFFTSDAHIYYQSSCEDRAFCHAVVSGRKKKSPTQLSSFRSGQSTHFATCNLCCDTDYCNKELCDIPTNATNHLKRCLNCDLVDDPKSCNHVIGCGTDQFCSTEKVLSAFGELRYRLGCASLTECFVKPTSSANEVILDKRCCPDEYCNRDLFDLMTTRKYTTTLPPTTVATTTSAPPTTTTLPKTSASSNMKECLSCHLIDDPKACFQAVMCDDNHYCSSKRVLTTSGHIQYILGCSALPDCIHPAVKLLQVFGKRSGQYSVLDGHCCLTSYCNRDLYNSQATPVPVTIKTTPVTTATQATTPVPTSGSGVHCFQCDSVSDPTACYTTTSCAQGEYCTTTELVTPQGQLRYKLGCSNLAACHTSIGTSLGKRSQDTTIQTACCQKDLCNRDLLDEATTCKDYDSNCMAPIFVANACMSPTTQYLCRKSCNVCQRSTSTGR